MIRNVVIAAVAALALAGCQTDEPVTLTTTKYKVVIPSDALYRCPTVNNLPNPDTLTDIQVARLLEQLSQNNSICRASIQQVKIFLNKAKTEFDRR